MYLKKLAMGGGLAAALALGAASTANAGLVSLMLDDGLGNSVTVVDGGADDANALAGVVTFVGSVGAWTLNVSTAAGTDLLGLGNIDLNSINAGVGSLTVAMTETGLADIGVATFSGDIGGTTNGTIAWSMYVDADDAAFGQGTLIGSDFSATSPFAASLSGSADTGGQVGTYSWSLFVDITHAAGTTLPSTSFDFEGNVPAPASAALLGLGLLGMGLARRRRSV